ncbi:FG-GAP repeat protein, partial [Lamprobacter modestohalophilus]|uniref:FG-GAP repeat protein n=1 Tax=Lamprobacter modestohalophilus TaxID=1064514 RepID=UPI002ADEC428
MLLALLSASSALAKPDVPPDLWQAFTEARHAFTAEDDGFVGTNHGNGQRIRFTDVGLQVRSTDPHEDWHWGLTLSGYGTPDQIAPVAPATQHLDGNRLEYRRGPITEWYLNKPIGLEQGFTLTQPPAPGAEQLVLELAVTGALTVEWREPSQALAFYTPDGDYALSYDKLKVVDANGVLLPATLALNDDQLRIQVDAKDAAWPIIVDPLVSNDEQKVTAPITGDGQAGDEFGHAVALSGDTALIGAMDHHAGLRLSGSVYVFVRSGSTWTQQAKLTASDAAERDEFGSSVAISGDTALIGAPKDADSGFSSGSAYIFVRSGTTWTQQSKLLPEDPGRDDLFGTAVTLDGDTALIGSSLDDDTGSDDSGSAYVFVRSGSTWTQQAKLTASDAAERAEFGSSVALSGDTALIGDHRYLSGAAYVFVRSGTTWIQQAKLTSISGSIYERFGSSVALSGDTALIGAHGSGSGAAYVFVRSGTTWSQQARLTSDDGVSGGYFGDSVALSGDTALIGAPRDDENGYTGAAYVFVRSGITWSQQVKLAATDVGREGQFGNAVALSGDTALIGAYFADTAAGPGAGSAYVFTSSDNSWSQQAKLTAGVGVDDSWFGNAVALSGDTALIGAPQDDDQGSSTGSVFVFVRSGGRWSQQAKLTRDGPQYSGKFGSSVALAGDTALIGAPYDNDNGSRSGAAYVFERSGTTWSQQAKLTAGDGERDDVFGTAVSLDGDTALIGARGSGSGAAYVFKRSGTTWIQQAKLTPADDGGSWGSFGISVALFGDTALIGASQDDDNGSLTGAAYVFVRSGTTWSQQVKLAASDASEVAEFGSSVALSEYTALIGAPRDRDSAFHSGSAYIFVRSGATWTQQSKLLPADPGPRWGDSFGTAVALDGDTALIGARGDDDNGTDSGSAYVFVRSGGTWTEQTKLTASDGAEGAELGSSVALSGDTALIGAPESACGAVESCGAAYFFDLNRISAGIGLYNPSRSMFYLRNSPSNGAADATFIYGPGGRGWQPLIGDWNGDGQETIGLYNPS